MVRLFFGIDLEAPWPDFWPKGRVLTETNRHITLAFLGEFEEKKIPDLLSKCPLPSFLFSPLGQFDKCLLLPEKKMARVVAWHLAWAGREVPLFQDELAKHLVSRGFSFSQKPWLSHVTLARAPLDAGEWLKAFEPIPCYAKAFHLFESLGSSTYRSLCSKPFQPPFREREHTADMCFLIYGEDFSSLYRHAALALSFKHPLFFDCTKNFLSLSSLEDVIIALNQSISFVDAEVGCPFKAVSFHGEVQKMSEEILQWEMIVDV